MTIVSTRGRRLLVCVGLSTCVGICSGCTDSPAGPGKTIPPVTGTWSGTYRVTTCSATFEILPCSYFVPTTNAMRLVLTQDGVNVSGTFTSDILTKPLAVMGSMDLNGVLRLQGTQEFHPDICGGSLFLKLEIADWTMALDATGSAFTGTFRQSVSRYYFSCYPGKIDFQTEIVSLTRSPSI